VAELEPVLYTPLQGARFSAAGLVIGENPFCAKAIVRGDFSDQKFVADLTACVEPGFDIAANQFAADDDYIVHWLGPDERLVHAVTEPPEALQQRLRKAVSGRHASVVDVSDYYTVVRIVGENARDVLSTGTPLDIDESVFKPGASCQTRFGQASILLTYRESGPVFEAQVRWSFAEYFWRYLQRVAKMR